ncbi:MAG TPA: DUF1501 domain-containing protein [Pirellulaceae bacterium]|nr:DUF1501 domain-containing protein [Pirellulaceae bacterium]
MLTTLRGTKALGRRELLHIGGLSLLGLSAGQLESLRAHQPAARERAKSCVFLFLFGGPSQVDLWDMKPAAPPEIRGEFKPVATNVPGTAICEHLPRLAQIMDKVCLVRSMTHRMNVHGPACSEVFTGREYFQAPTTDQASREDWPSLSSLVMRYGSSASGLAPSVVLPWYLQFPGQAKRIAGQTGARMGELYNALLVNGDVGRADYEITGLALHPDLPMQRLHERRGLLRSIDLGDDGRAGIGEALSMLDANRSRAWSLLENRAGEVLDLKRETQQTRERYGQTTVGQSLLMARRLVEAGVPLVTVNWQDETHIDGVNTCWDTHQNNFPKLKDLLCPLFDRAFSAFVSDLGERGLLESTLVVALGEFGRTPRMGQFSQSANTQKTGRDHWPHAFTALLAGGGIRGGQVYGATNDNGGYVIDKPVSPADLSATILSHLGIDPSQTYHDEFQKLPRKLSEGKVIKDLG